MDFASQNYTFRDIVKCVLKRKFVSPENLSFCPARLPVITRIAQFLFKLLLHYPGYQFAHLSLTITAPFNSVGALRGWYSHSLHHTCRRVCFCACLICMIVINWPILIYTLYQIVIILHSINCFGCKSTCVCRFQDTHLILKCIISWADSNVQKFV